MKLGLGLALAALAYGLLSHAPASAQLPGQGDLFVVSANCCGIVADFACCGGAGGLIRVNVTTGAQTLLASGANLLALVGIAQLAISDRFVVDPSCCD